MQDYEFHPLSAIFPLMNQEGIRELGLDIKNNEQKEAIVLFEGKILDGRNRYLACKMFNIVPRYEKLKEGIDPLTFIISKNLYRRHLNTAQKCEIALKLLKIERKKAKTRQIRTQFKQKSKNNNLKSKETVRVTLPPTENDREKGKSIEITAKKANVSSRTLKKAIKIKEAAEKEPEIEKSGKKQNRISFQLKVSIRKLKKRKAKKKQQKKVILILIIK